MFTGLIETTGRIERLEDASGRRQVHVATTMAAELTPGDSIAINGVCLTATTTSATAFTADLSSETLRVTTFGELVVGHVVNLERPLRADARIGGHFVLGHVDGVATVTEARPEGEGRWLELSVPEALSPLVVSKGSIAVDGTSLTIARLVETTVALQIVPFTAAHTTLGRLCPGDRVNVEVDVLGKYVARLLGGSRVGEPIVAPAGEEV